MNKTVLQTRGNKLIFDRTLKAAKVIKKLKEKYKFIFIIQTIIMKDTYKQIPKLLNFAIDNKA